LGFQRDALGDVVNQNDAATETKSRESRGAMAMLAVRISPARVVRGNL